MGVLKSSLGFALADALGVEIAYDHAAGCFKAEGDIDFNLAGSRVRVPIKVVSSLTSENAYMILVRLIGNLAILLVAKPVKTTTIVDLHVLNIARMDAITDWLEKKKPASVNDTLDKLGSAVVASFVKFKKNEWKEA